ncbi:hypothetical protein DFS34DRAFT_226536 [Phlyctochytrium arcticum]|nr:hypothetical protein DFS34DRAFT_226536 [Phlyctochytrium arcticum]
MSVAATLLVSTFKQPSFGIKGGKPEFCAFHEAANHINVRKARCQSVGCNKMPNYGPEGGRRLFCAGHKALDHFNGGGLRCRHPGCYKRPGFGLVDGKALFCAAHNAPDHVGNNNAPCRHAGCVKQPHYGIQCGKGRFCSVHKAADLVNVSMSGIRIAIIQDATNTPCLAPKAAKLAFVWSIRGGITLVSKSPVACLRSAVRLPSTAPKKVRPFFAQFTKARTITTFWLRSARGQGVKSSLLLTQGVARQCSVPSTGMIASSMSFPPSVMSRIAKSPLGMDTYLMAKSRCTARKTVGMYFDNRPVCLCGDTDMNVVESKCHTCDLVSLIRKDLVNCNDCHQYHTTQPAKERSELYVKKHPG